MLPYIHHRRFGIRASNVSKMRGKGGHGFIRTSNRSPR